MSLRDFIHTRMPISPPFKAGCSFQGLASPIESGARRASCRVLPAASKGLHVVSRADPKCCNVGFNIPALLLSLKLRCAPLDKRQ
jgi:hypothetical protein